MITLNTERVTIEVPSGAFDQPLALKLRDTGKIFGHLIATKNQTQASLHIINQDSTNIEQLENEAILTFSQYLLHRESIKEITTTNLTHDYADPNDYITQASINAYASNLPVVRVAIVIIKNQDGTILIGKRPEGFYLPGLWEFPGGKIEPSESPETAGHREIMEEIGIQIQSSAELTQFNYCFPDKRLEGHLRLTTQWTGNPKNLHHSGITWVKPSELISYQMPVSNVLALPKILERISVVY